jgi:hypothetical protein
MRRSRFSSERLRWVRRAAAVLLALLTGSRGTAAEVDAVGPIVVVVGTSSPIRDVTVDGLREVYLRRRRIWPDGTPSLPVNLPADHPVRRAFSRRVLGRLPEDLASHWGRLAFDGVRPPPVLQTAQAVCAYVAVEPTAIGYVPLIAVDAASCRVLFRIVEDGGAAVGR